MKTPPMAKIALMSKTILLFILFSSAAPTGLKIIYTIAETGITTTAFLLVMSPP